MAAGTTAAPAGSREDGAGIGSVQSVFSAEEYWSQRWCKLNPFEITAQPFTVKEVEVCCGSLFLFFVFLFMNF